MSLKYIPEELSEAIGHCNTMPVNGRILQVAGTVVKAILPQAKIGELCLLKNLHDDKPVPAEVIGIEKKDVLLAPIGDMSGMSTSTQVVPTGTMLNVPVGNHLLGCVLDGVGNVISSSQHENPVFDEYYPVIQNSPDPLSRNKIDKPLSMGVKALDGLITCGIGQRMGVFAGAGVGKSTFISMLVAHAEVDVNVVALIGERGREVREFIEDSLGEENLKKTVLIVATSDKPAIERLKAAYVATAVAEYFRDKGKSVLLLMDSITRFARAQREIGLSAGEAPARRGFPPSVFAELPKLVERAGCSDKGSITAFYTVLVEGDDMSDPIADEIRSLLDGHILLSRKLAAKGHYPAIDILESLSRVMPSLVGPEHIQASIKINELLAKYDEVEFLLRVGEYRQGSDPLADEAIAKIDAINAFLKQSSSDAENFQDTLAIMLQIVN
ncbi:MAG: Flagellum-specific ATP synthase FliI [uncultured Thiotrichaceae bacterium]|uniref:Type 3 secretion system ATPase n=1 Tax=uncultured Thiotrichaceae bacterium TaxID=298394 RepID=A0A6S6TBY0_9GAMM|nr:MAG: Flagellum-specific ATP synthase FliI [uncultured Thiotrichaceae bacterium]